MGAGASIPDKLDLEKTKELAGERFDDGQFETMAGPDGCITREQLLEAGNLVDFDASKLTEEVARNGMFFSFNEFDEVRAPRRACSSYLGARSASPQIRW